MKKTTKGIFIVPIGTIDYDILKSIAYALGETFSCSVSVDKGIPIPHDAYNNKRRQYHSTAIIRNIQFLKPDVFRYLIGVIDADLYVPELNFVFGEADILTGVAVISLTRLRQEFYGHPANRELFHLRAIKEAIHEIGHIYGLGHCRNQKCVMRFSISIRDTDVKGHGFCEACSKSMGRGSG